MSEDIFNTLQQFYPGETFPEPEIRQAVAAGEIIDDPQKILPFLLTCLVDEKVLEVEVDGVPKIYFSRLQDHPPEEVPEKEEEDETEEPPADVVQEKLEDEMPVYTEGDYLSDLDHLLILPLEPGMGNLFLRQSHTVVMRMFTRSLAVEMCSHFKELTKVGNLPVIRLNYPVILRKIRNRREYRAKVIDGLDCIASVEIDEELDPLNFTIADISVSGIALSMTRKEHKLFQEGNNLPIKLYIDDELRVAVDTTIRRLKKLRKRQRVEYICGLEYQEPSKYTAAALESIVAEVQRAHLKELADKANAGGFDAIT